MTTIILKNTTLDSVVYGGRTIPAEGENDFTGYPQEILETLLHDGLKAAIISGDIVVNNGSTDLTADRGWRYMLGIPVKLYRHNGSQVQAFAGNYTTLLFDTVVNGANDGFTYYTIAAGPTTGGSLTVLESGTYDISYDVTIDNESSSRTQSNVRITVNNVEVAGSLASGYHRTIGIGRCTVTATVTVALNANDVIRVQAQSASGNNLKTVANACRLNVLKVSD